MTRLAIKTQGVRPALVPHDLKHPLQELMAFRHVFVHACELEFDPEKLALLLKYAHRVAALLPTLIEDFILDAREQQFGL